VDLQNEAGHVFPAVRSPVEAKIEADIYTYYQTSSSIVAGDFTTQSALGLWNPSDWCQKISTISSGGNNPAYFNAQGLRGCRTRQSFSLSGDLNDLTLADVVNGGSFEYSTVGRTFATNELFLEETTEVDQGKSVFRQVVDYTLDITDRYTTVGGVFVFTMASEAKGQFTFEVRWTGSQWKLTGTNVILDKQPSISGANQFVYSAAANGGQGAFTASYTNQTSTSSFSFTASNGGDNPSDATWGTGVTATATSNTEEYGATSSSSATFSGNSIAANFSFIEGRAIEQGSVGKIRISGGPPNPLGKVYTLDVQLEKAFTKVDGADVYRKTIVVATCTPA